MTRLTKARTHLVLEHPFIGSIALGMLMRLMTPEEEFMFAMTKGTPTADVEGVRIRFSESFVNALSDQQLVFLVAHECFHPMLEHNYRLQDRDPRKWNRACDYVINQLLVDEQIGEFILGVCFDPVIYEQGGGTSEGIYNILPNNPSAVEGIGEDIIQADEETSKQALAEWKIKVAQAAQTAKIMGKLSANMARLVDQLLEARVDWREVLKRFVQSAKVDTRTFARPARRFICQDLYMPTVAGESMGELVFAIDMSGSIAQDVCNQFAAECAQVFEDFSPQKLHLIFFSSDVCAHDVLEPDDEFKFNARGGGGTAFSPVFQYVRENNINPAGIIFLTDLECNDYGEPPDCPVLWVSTKKNSAPFGEVVYM